MMVVVFVFLIFLRVKNNTMAILIMIANMLITEIINNFPPAIEANPAQAGMAPFSSMVNISVEVANESR